MRRISLGRVAAMSAAVMVSVFGSILAELVLADTSTPINISASGVAVTENFGSLASSGTSSLTPFGFGFSESSGNTVYTAGTGTGTSGDTYSFGAASTTERALGGVRSGSNIPTLGASFTNYTGNPITSLDISYTGEQWRLGTSGRGSDRLDFQIGVAATSLTSAGYVDADALDFTGPINVGTVGALDGNAAANRVAITATINGLNIPNGATFFIRWVDVDVSGADDGLAIDDFSLTATAVASPTDTAPAITTTTPSSGATGIAISSNFVINFSESVTASPAAFALNCAGPQGIAVAGSGTSTLTIDPDLDLPYDTLCTVSVTGASVFDTDSNDPPDTMAANANFTFTTESAPVPVATNVVINEVDSDQDGTDAGEFIELYDGGVGNTSLTGLTVVLFNGSSDTSYAAYDLDGFTTNAAGYFTLGNAAVLGVDLVFANNFLQNGADAVALYAANGSNFPNGAAVTTTNLQDAVVYDSDDPDDVGLLALLNGGEPQVNENGSGNITGHSIGRCDNGTGGARNTSSYRAGTPSPEATNNCPPPPPPPSDSVIVISQVYGGGGNDGAVYQSDYVELFNRGTVTVDTLGWTLQYASATGSGWDFNKTPLGGLIAPGEYYLVKLASNGATGLELPAANVEGPINLSGTNGKIALVSSFEALSGNCPIANPNLEDLVGYGTADCFEGAGASPATNVAVALLRNGGGLIDTDTNSADLATGTANPRRTAPIVELPPFVLSTDPSSNAQNVPRDPTLAITFTEPVDVVGSWFDITCTVSGQHNSHTLAGGGRIWDITPNVTMVGGEQCTATLFASQIHDQDTVDGLPNTDTLLANHTWTFTVSNGTAPPYPSSVHLTMGNPTNATADVGQPQNFLMEKPEFTLSYNRDQGRPNWVSWHLSNEWYGTLTRVESFRADPQVPADWYRVQGFDFSGSGFDRGHMVPNADRDKETSIPINQATFLMTNMVAQAGGNNQGPWADMEAALRVIADEGNELYIVAGPEGVGGTGDFGGVTTTIANGQVTVPANTWKVAIVLPTGTDDLSRVTCATRTIAVIMPNVESIGNDDWQDYLTSVDAVEALTGYDLFSNLPDGVEYCVEAGINGNNPPADLDPPVIQCAAPDGAWHTANVTLACTASDGASGLDNSANASFSLITAVGAGGEDADAATDSRVVCDAVGNCATAGPIAGNKIDRKAPTVTISTPVNGAVFQLGRAVIAAFTCADAGSGAATCVGSVANGAAIDTSTVGSKAVTVDATDAVGNASSATVSYTVASSAVSISNMPAQAFVGDSFTVAFAYAGDGVATVTSRTPNRCTVAGNQVTFLKRGGCQLQAHAAGTPNFDAATGPVQTVTITKRTATISILNLPTNATNGGSFVPTYLYTGDGEARVHSITPQVCRVREDGTTVRYVGGGTCTLVARARRTERYFRAIGEPQSFVVAAAPVTISIRNIPNHPRKGKAFSPHFDYAGNGETAVISSTPSVCGVSRGAVHFLAAGTCTLTAEASATADYLAAAGSPQSFMVSLR